ncbi:hypothetical protein QFZ66_007663 [Streptomyces sp. B4I13]|uniref:hypothetical protein n=1 Tax=Streptomyces sp. B4I13 TaxID=3042271 RepID=UPI00278068A0|nr:hypothetical protein [Streptomyces sp. B4I13]MDQ0963785.1 hypothetical protein [Streptomyces sp. B4I13]
MSYAFDPELAHWVPMITDLPFSDMAAARGAGKAMTANLPMYEPDRPVDVRAAVVPGPEDTAQVPVRIYTPVGAEVHTAEHIAAAVQVHQEPDGTAVDGPAAG